MSLGILEWILISRVFERFLSLCHQLCVNFLLFLLSLLLLDFL